MQTRAAFALSICLLAAAPLRAQTAPAPAPAALNPTPAPADTPVTITKPLSNQPGAKPVSRRQARAADDAFLAGSAFLEKDQPEKAEKAFEHAEKLNPEKQEYSVAAAIARENVVSAMVRKSQVMRSAGNSAGADALLASAAKLDPENELVTEHMHQTAEPQVQIEPYLPSGDGVEQPRYAPVVEFTPLQQTASFHFRADAHEVLRRILLAYGLKAQFNSDVPADSVRIDIDDVNFDQMRPILAMMTRTFLVPIDPTTAMVLKDTPENREQYVHLAVETVYMPGFTTEQIHDAVSMLQQVLDIQKVNVGTAGGTVTIRAPLDMMKLANYELADLMDGGSQLLLEMKVYSIDKTRTRDVGISIPQTVSGYNVASQASQILSQNQSEIAALIANGTIPANASLTQIAIALIASGAISSSIVSNTVAFLGGSIIGVLNGTSNPNPFAFTGISEGSPLTLNMALNSSEAKSLEDMQLSVGDQKTATFRVGTRYPIITASYSAGGAASSLLSGATSAQLAALGISSAAAAAAATQVSIPQIQYEDLGLTLKAIPTVMRSGNVSMQIDLKIEALAGSALNSIPILASRALTSSVTVAPGQTAVLVSSMSRQEDNAVSGIPGLSELPGFQSTTNKNGELDTSELVITLTPRLVRRGRDRIASLPLAVPHAAAAQEREDQ